LNFSGLKSEIQIRISAGPLLTCQIQKLFSQIILRKIFVPEIFLLLFHMPNSKNYFLKLSCAKFCSRNFPTFSGEITIRCHEHLNLRFNSKISRFFLSHVLRRNHNIVESYTQTSLPIFFFYFQAQSQYVGSYLTGAVRFRTASHQHLNLRFEYQIHSFALFLHVFPTPFFVLYFEYSFLVFFLKLFLKFLPLVSFVVFRHYFYYHNSNSEVLYLLLIYLIIHKLISVTN
jgi:hypothetical protein